MHDSQIEDRLRGVLRAEGDALSWTITADELGRRLALRRRERTGRRLSLMAAGLAVVAIGSVVATTSGWFRVPAIGTGPKQSSEPLQTPHQSFGPAATPLPGISPLVATPGRTELIRIDPAAPIDQADGTATAAAGGRSVIVSMSCVGDGSIELDIEGVPESLGCVSAGPSSMPNGWFDVADGQVDLTYSATGPISFGILVEQPGVGEAPPTGDDVVCEPLDPSLSEAPPAIGAGVVPGDSLGHGGTISAYRWNGQEVGTPGSWADAQDDFERIVVSPNAEAIEIVSDQCLYDARAESLLTNTRQTDPPTSRLSVLRGIGTRVVDIEPPAVGLHLVRVRASFATTDGSPGWSEAIFRVIVIFDAPTLTMSPGQSQAGQTAVAGCASYVLASGAQAADSCAGPYDPRTGVTPLIVGAGSSVTIMLSDGWALGRGYLDAVALDDAIANPFTDAQRVATFEGGDQVEIPIDLPAGTWVVRVGLNGSRGGDTFGTWYDLRLDVR